jgi:beta-glucosidase
MHTAASSSLEEVKMQAAPLQGARVVTRSSLKDLFAPDFFLWATGIEDTFITDPHRKTGRTLDEYELTHHYELWREDIDLIAALGVRYARYGIPWYRVEPSPGRFDFCWTDEVFERMLDNGVHPIVDLVHYGTPTWLTGGFGNADYPKRVADYAGAIAERYKGRIYWYTPLNEPRITAHYCGRLGWWPPYGRGWKGFLDVMTSVSKGIALTQQVLREVDPEIVCAHVDATDFYRSSGPETETTARHRQGLVFLALDLVMGRVDSNHPLLDWILKFGVAEGDLQWFSENRIQPDVIGLNLYPMFTNKVVTGSRIKMSYGKGELVYELGKMYFERYGRPIFISETAAVGRRRQAWMDDSFASVRRLRAEGIPMVGYTWWPLFALVAWAYREKDLAFNRYLLQMGLWDLAMREDGKLARVPTALVDSYSAAVEAKSECVGLLRSEG